MKISANQLNEILKGEIVGNADVEVSSPAKIEEAQPGSISFLANPKYENYAYSTQASILIVADSFQPKATISSTMIKVKDPYAAFTSLLQFYQKMTLQKKEGIEQPSYIASTAEISSGCFVGAFTYISEQSRVGEETILHQQVFLGPNVKIGKNCVIHSGVKIYKDCVIGDHCIIHSNTVIGSDGFGFSPNATGSFDKIPQLGNVVIGNHVEIGSNACIDRATIGSTILRDGVKLDNLVQIAHNVEIMENTVIAAQSGVSGSTKIGKNCMIGGQVGFVGHIEIASGTKVQAQSGVNKSITQPNTAVYGSPALDYKDFVKSYVIFRKLPEVEKRVQELEKGSKKI